MLHTKPPKLTHLCLSAVLLCATLVTSQAEPAEQNNYEPGQLWECTVRHEKAPPTERLQFFVTGKAIKRDISPRDNFQTDDVIVSVALFDRDPQACIRVRRFSHIGFDQSSLDACMPTRQSDAAAAALSDELKQKIYFARISWLQRMQAKQGVVVGLTPSRIVGMLRRKRCG